MCEQASLLAASLLNPGAYLSDELVPAEELLHCLLALGHAAQQDMGCNQNSMIQSLAQLSMGGTTNTPAFHSCCRSRPIVNDDAATRADGVPQVVQLIHGALVHVCAGSQNGWLSIGALCHQAPSAARVHSRLIVCWALLLAPPSILDVCVPIDMQKVTRQPKSWQRLKPRGF